mmetsp:Transcript_5503/g.13792  ORF Transcript_5503/g.13792 Transcript_5503/m.13792 type:complete len:220 (+) Transcript_5503:1818-2477(+)
MVQGFMAAISSITSSTLEHRSSTDTRFAPLHPTSFSIPESACISAISTIVEHGWLLASCMMAWKSRAEKTDSFLSGGGVPSGQSSRMMLPQTGSLTQKSPVRAYFDRAIRSRCRFIIPMDMVQDVEFSARSCSRAFVREMLGASCQCSRIDRTSASNFSSDEERREERHSLTADSVPCDQVVLNQTCAMWFWKDSLSRTHAIDPACITSCHIRRVFAMI